MPIFVQLTSKLALGCNHPHVECVPGALYLHIKLAECEGDHSVPSSGQVNPYPTAFPYGNGMVLHFYQQQESSTTKTVHKVINKGLKTYV